jgi:hypothetical protein
MRKFDHAYLGSFGIAPLAVVTSWPYALSKPQRSKLAANGVLGENGSVIPVPKR